MIEVIPKEEQDSIIFKNQIKYPISRIEKALHGKTPEEQYLFINWLLHDYGNQFNSTELAVIDWLRGGE